MKRPGFCEKLIYAALLLAIITLLGTYATGYLNWLIISGLILLFTIAIVYVCLLSYKDRAEAEAEKAKENQARQILKIAESTLPYLRQGLDISTASKVAEAIIKYTDADAVALTDRKKVLAFRGAGEDHHHPGQKIQTRATRGAIKEGKTKILTSREDIGCPNKNCTLKAAVVVPLKRNDVTVATLKLYYQDNESLTSSVVALAEGLAHLLETQLALSEISRLEFLACEAELKALQSQINPHFFFNVLNTAVSYCRLDPLKARQVLLDFSNFFRTTIEHGEEPLITLDAELSLVKNYIELESSRFGSKLVFNNLVSDEARSWKLPPFTLQPIVENAIQHAFIPGKPLVITIRNFKTADLKIIEVEDNGRGIPEDVLPTVLLKGKGKGLGVGLSLVHERLKLLYGEEYGLSIESKEGKGTKVRIIIPTKATITLLDRLPEK